MDNMRFFRIAMLPRDNNVRKLLHEDILMHRRQEGSDNRRFMAEECTKMFRAYEATSNQKYHRCYQIMTEMLHRQRQ